VVNPFYVTEFDNNNDRLRNIEQGGQMDEAAATARAQCEREAATAKLEADAKRAMEETGRAFLKE
jgi:hypothetical protein